MTGAWFQYKNAISILTIVMGSTLSHAADWEDNRGRLEKPRSTWRASSGFENSYTQWGSTEYSTTNTYGTFDNGANKSTSGGESENSYSKRDRASEAIKEDFLGKTSRPSNVMSVDEAKRFIDSKIAEMQTIIEERGMEFDPYKRGSKAWHISLERNMLEDVHRLVFDAQGTDNIIQSYLKAQKFLQEKYGAYPRQFDALFEQLESRVDPEKIQWTHKQIVRDLKMRHLEVARQDQRVLLKGTDEWIANAQRRGAEFAIKQLEAMKFRFYREEINLVKEFETIQNKILEREDINLLELDIADEVGGRKYVTLDGPERPMPKALKRQGGYAKPNFTRAVSAFSLAALLGATVSEKVKAHNESLAEQESSQVAGTAQ